MTTKLFNKLDNNRTTYINADDIGAEVGLNHSMVNQVIRRNKDALENVSRERVNYRRGKNGAKVFLLNQPQAILATMFMKSNAVVKQFSTDLVKQTYPVAELVEDKETKRVNKLLRSEIKLHDQEHNYKKYFGLAYRVALGRSVKQLRESLNIPDNKVITNFLNSDDVKRVNQVKLEIVAELKKGETYHSIKFKLLTK